MIFVWGASYSTSYNMSRKYTSPAQFIAEEKPKAKLDD